MQSAVRRARRVVIIDDSRTCQAILEAGFEQRPEFEVVGVAGDARSGLDLVKHLAPDLVTLDLCMPYIDGVGMLDLLSGLSVCKVIVSDEAARDAEVSARLQSLGAALCLGKRELVDDTRAFFKKVGKACDRAEAAGRRDGAAHHPAAPRHVETPAETSPVRFGFPVPLDERARLVALERKGLANAVRERQFDLVTRHTAEATQFPVSLITFIDRDTQWIKSSFGVAINSTPRAGAFCNYTIASGTPFVVPNARRDERFAQSPLVTREPGICTYAGHPITSADGVRLGALCVVDAKPRPVTPFVARQLATIAEIVGDMIDSRPSLAA